MLYCAPSGVVLICAPSPWFSFSSIFSLLVVVYLCACCCASYRPPHIARAVIRRALCFGTGAIHGARHAQPSPLFPTHSTDSILFHVQTTIANARASAHTLLGSPFAQKNTALKPFGLVSPVFLRSLRPRKRSRTRSRVFR